MTRAEVTQEILDLQAKDILVEAGTGLGKSRLALIWIMDKIEEKQSPYPQKILIVIPRNVLKKSWEEEFRKWWPNVREKHIVTYTTYVSFPKRQGRYNYIIYDECHHLSERCRDALNGFIIDHNILLSATVNNNLKQEFRRLFPNIIMYKRSLRTVIEDEILPDPKVYLMPLDLRQDIPTEIIWKNQSLKTKIIECQYKDRWNYIKKKTNPIKIHCTEREYYSDLCKQIEYWKNRHRTTRSEIAKNKYLRLCGERLKWLSDKKVSIVSNLLGNLKKYRILTFCNSIEQTELLGEYCINSKNDNALKYLEYFNKGKINHITACNMINEGCNLYNCQIGIYANLNSSETIVKQRCGRILRHPNPIIIVPYYRNTREEELMNKMLEDYNPELVKEINNIKDIKI